MSQVIEAREMGVVTQELLNQYSKASADPNPIHLNEEAAKKVGLPGVIAHGMLIAAWVAERARQFHKEELKGKGKMVSIEFRFKSMTFLDSRIKVGGTIKEQTPERVVIELTATQEDVQETKINSIVKFTF